MNKLVKVLAMTGLTLVSLSAFGANAFAQGETLPVQKPIRVKLGGSFGGGKVEGISGVDLGSINYRFNVGVAYDFSKTTATSPVLFNVYADYFSGSKDKSIANTKVKLDGTTFGIGVGARFLLAPAVGTSGQPYGELGLGYYSTKLKADGAGYSESKTDGKVGGKVALGYQLNMGAFGEVEYTIIDKFDKNGITYNPSSIRASVGYRF